MNFLDKLQAYLIENLKLDAGKLYGFGEDGSLKFTPGSENQDYMANYKAMLVVSDYAKPLDQLFLFVAKFVQTEQPFTSRKDNNPRFEWELLSRNRFNVYIEIDVQEIVTVTVEADGTRLTPADPPQIDEDDAPDLVSPEGQHTPGGPNG